MLNQIVREDGEERLKKFLADFQNLNTQEVVALTPAIHLLPSPILSSQTGILQGNDVDFALSTFGIPNGATLILGSARVDFAGSYGSGLSIYLFNRAASYDLLVGAYTIDSNNWAYFGTPIALFAPQSSTNLRLRWSASSGSVSDPADISFRAFGYIA